MIMIANSTSAFYDRSAMDISALRARAEALQAQISSGDRLTQSSDNPVAASRLRTLSRASQLSTVDASNAGRASADLTLADSALSSFADYVTRARELTQQAANGTLTSSQRNSIGAELLQIHSSLVSLANTRDSAGHSLFGGETTGNAYVLDASGNAIYSGTTSAAELPLGDGQSVKRSLTGPEFLNFSVAGNPTSLMAVVKSLGDALQGAVADPQAAATAGLDALTQGLDAVTTGQTLVGSRLAWIELTSERRTALSELNVSEEAEVGGTDIAETVAELQQIMTVLEASQASFARLSSLSLFDVLR